MCILIFYVNICINTKRFIINKTIHHDCVPEKYRHTVTTMKDIRINKIAAISLIFMSLIVIAAPVSAWGQQTYSQPSMSSCFATAGYISSAAGAGAIAGPVGWLYAASIGYKTFQSSYNCGQWLGNLFYR